MLISGSTLRSKRKEEWHNHRLFFLTPQTVQNDLSMSNFPVKDIKCVVVDEAHRATKQYAYCKVIEEIYRQNKSFRVLALSATPGKDLFTIKQVVQNLLISKIEYRSEESMDVQHYNHGRRVQQIVVSLTPEIDFFKEKFHKILDHHLSLLLRVKAIPYYDLNRISNFSIMMNRQAFDKSTTSKPPNLINSIRFSFSVSQSLAYCVDLLVNHGLGCLYNHIFNREKKGKHKGVDLLSLMKNDKTFHEIVIALKDRFERGGGGEDAVGHPKIAKLVELVLTHFKTSSDEDTRIMIFSNFCNSVEEIAEVLDRYRPLVRPMKFVGQQSGKGLTQKQQLQIVKMFNEGSYNTLVATCVAEEGLDIGNVDLIICYDVSKSPIRLVQRMGRTGRHREGKIIVLMTEGKEENAFKDSIYNKKRVSHNLLLGIKPQDMFQHNQRLYPKGLKPICRKMFLGPVPKNDSQSENLETSKSIKGRKRSTTTSTPKEPKTSAKKKKKSPETPQNTKKRKKSRFDKYFEIDCAEDSIESSSKVTQPEVQKEDSQNTDIADSSFFADSSDFISGLDKDLKECEDEIFSDGEDENLLKVTAEDGKNTKAASPSKKDEEDYVFDDDDDDLLALCPSPNVSVAPKRQEQSNKLPSQDRSSVDLSLDESLDDNSKNISTQLSSPRFEFSSELTTDNFISQASKCSSTSDSKNLHVQSEEIFDEEDDYLLMSVNL